MRRGHRLQIGGASQGDQPGAGAQASRGGHHRRTALAEGTGHHQQVAEGALVAICRARRQQRTGLAGVDQQAVVRSRNGDAARHADRYGNHLTGIPGAGIAVQTDLRQGEGHGQGGPYRAAGHPPGTGVDAGGKIDGDHRRGLPIEPVDGRGQVACGGPGAAGAEQGVHIEAAAVSRAEGGQQAPLLRGHGNHAATRFENLQHGRSITAQSGPFGKQHGGHLPAGIAQVPGDHQTVAAVVAAPAQDQHRPRQECGKAGLNRLGRTAPGVFHQHHAGETDLGNGAAVEFLHGGSRQDFHAPSRITVATA